MADGGGAAAGGGAGGSGSGSGGRGWRWVVVAVAMEVVVVVVVVVVEVKFVQCVGLGWVRRGLNSYFFSPVNFDSPCFLLSDPKVNWFSFFGLIGSNGSVRLEIMLLPFASFPLHDTPKLAGAVIYSLTH